MVEDFGKLHQGRQLSINCVSEVTTPAQEMFIADFWEGP